MASIGNYAFMLKCKLAVAKARKADDPLKLAHTVRHLGDAYYYARDFEKSVVTLDGLAHPFPPLSPVAQDLVIAGGKMYNTADLWKEAGFKPWQESSAGAAGPWQFTPGTARAFGLRVDGHVVLRLAAAIVVGLCGVPVGEADAPMRSSPGRRISCPHR
jgi:hypothetical protein